MRGLLLFFLAILALAGAAYIAYFYIEAPPENNEVLTLYGNIDIRQVDLGFRVNGRVLKMFFQEGDTVSPGDLLAVLDKQPYEDLVKQAAAHVESVAAALAKAQIFVDRRKELAGTKAVSQEDFDEALSNLNIYKANLKESQASLGVANTNLEDTEVYAPADGIILTRIREPGTVVREADPIYTISLSNPIWVRAYISEVHLGNIYPGMVTEIHTDTPGGHVYTGRIGFISPVAEFTPKTVETTQLRTDLVYRLRIIADNPDRELRQGMPVTVKIPLQKVTNHHEEAISTTFSHLDGL